MQRTLSLDEVKAFYDRFGAKQDAQAFYEDRALDDLIAHAALDSARHVFEFGCGTGRLAERILDGVLPREATYHGVDVSETMVRLAAHRLERFGARATVQMATGANPFARLQVRPDRILTTYVLDLLAEEEIASFVDCAARVLPRDGRLCIASLTDGNTAISGVVSGVWRALFRIAPRLVGGCRPIRLISLVASDALDLVHHRVVSSFGIASEIAVSVKTVD